MVGALVEAAAAPLGVAAEAVDSASKTEVAKHTVDERTPIAKNALSQNLEISFAPDLLTKPQAEVDPEKISDPMAEAPVA
jgi:hypothetical protein